MARAQTNLDERIRDFLAEGPWAVAGASQDRGKFGNKVLRCYLQHGREAHPLNPSAALVEGVPAHRDLAALAAALGRPPRGLSVVTPPRVTEALVEEAARVGTARLWMQPGAESPLALRRAEELGLEVVAGGPCLLVVLGYRD